jgi:hypothetical protein
MLDKSFPNQSFLHCRAFQINDKNFSGLSQIYCYRIGSAVYRSFWVYTAICLLVETANPLGLRITFCPDKTFPAARYEPLYLFFRKE